MYLSHTILENGYGIETRLCGYTNNNDDVDDNITCFKRGTDRWPWGQLAKQLCKFVCSAGESRVCLSSLFLPVSQQQITISLLQKLYCRAHTLLLYAHLPFCFVLLYFLQFPFITVLSGVCSWEIRWSLFRFFEVFLQLLIPNCDMEVHN